VLALIAFGMLGIMSIGFPFLLVGLTLAALRTYRQRPSVFWPVLALVVGFLIGYVVVVPLSCSLSVTSSTGVAGSVTSREICRTLLGSESTGSPSADALFAGATGALIAAATAAMVIRRRPGRGRPVDVP
jgi:hypothetical protein